MSKKISPCTAASVHGHVKFHPEFDSDIIAQYPVFVRVVVYVGAALLISGLPIIALAAFEMWLLELFGLPAFFGSMALDLAIVFWLVCYGE